MIVLSETISEPILKCVHLMDYSGICVYSYDKRKKLKIYTKKTHVQVSYYLFRSNISSNPNDLRCSYISNALLEITTHLLLCDYLIFER